MKTLFLALLILVSALPGRADDLGQKVGPLLQSIRATLPKGWKAQYENETSCLVVDRDEPVLGTFTAINMDPGKEPEMSTYSFAFRVVDFVTLGQYQQWIAENTEIEKKARVIYDDFKRRGLLYKGGGLQPETTEDETAAARHEKLIESKHLLPDFYFQKISMQWVYGAPEPEKNGWRSFYVEDDRIRDECDQVRDKVMKLFSKYPDP